MAHLHAEGIFWNIQHAYWISNPSDNNNLNRLRPLKQIKAINLNNQLQAFALPSVLRRLWYIHFLPNFHLLLHSISSHF